MHKWGSVQGTKLSNTKGELSFCCQDEVSIHVMPAYMLFSTSLNHMQPSAPFLFLTGFKFQPPVRDHFPPGSRTALTWGPQPTHLPGDKHPSCFSALLEGLLVTACRKPCLCHCHLPSGKLLGLFKNKTKPKNLSASFLSIHFNLFLSLKSKPAL